MPWRSQRELARSPFRLVSFRALPGLPEQTNSLPRLDRVERDDSGDGDHVKEQNDQQRARQLHVRLRHVFVIHSRRRAEERRAVAARSFFSSEELAAFSFVSFAAGPAPVREIDRRDRRSF